MTSFFISLITSVIVSLTIMKFHMRMVGKLLERYMDLEKSNIEKFVKELRTNMPKDKKISIDELPRRYSESDWKHLQ